MLSPTLLHAQLSFDEAYRIIRLVYEREGFEITGLANRDSLNRALARAVGIVHFGHAFYNPTPDPTWCVKTGGPGRPQADDVIARCDTRQAWDLMGGIGGPSPYWAPAYIGVLPREQQIFAPPRPGSYTGELVRLTSRVTGHRVELAWSPAAIGSANVQHTLVAGMFGSIPMAGRTSATADLPDGVYAARVEATVEGIRLRPSNRAFAAVGTFAAPEAPRDVLASVVGNVATLDWEPPFSDGGAPIIGFALEAGAAPGTVAVTVPVEAAPTTFVTPPLPDGSYFVRLRAISAAGLSSAPSAEVRFGIGPPAPSAPVLGGSAGGAGLVALSWTPASAGAAATGYRLMAGTTPGAQDVAVLDLPSTATTFAASGVARGTYFVRVVAAAASGFGDVSNEVRLEVP